jgi:uncharacterized protein with HEPN domain
MNNLKNDEYFVRKMLTDLYFITEQMQGVSMRTLGENQVLMDSMCFRLIQIQENAKKLSEAYKLAHSEIQWRDIAGLRNYIVHDYGNVDLSILFSTLTSDIPNLIKELEQD